MTDLLQGQPGYRLPMGRALCGEWSDRAWVDDQSAWSWKVYWREEKACLRTREIHASFRYGLELKQECVSHRRQEVMPRHGHSFLLLSDRHALTALSVTFGRPPLAIVRPFRSAE